MAIAPESLGIGIRRHFTEPGEDPYGALEWERRDSRITNYRDGSVAFEQLGVEFPVDWSLNATNIVAQKYFRGTLGTPQRETSVRQLVSRQPVVPIEVRDESPAHLPVCFAVRVNTVIQPLAQSIESESR
jgi:hypothetical protein